MTDVGPAPPPAPEEKKNFGQRVVGVLFAPDETFRDIVFRPDIVWPLVVLLAIAIVSTFIVVPRLDMVNAMRDQMAASNPNMSADDIERSVRFMSAFSKMFGYIAPLLAVGFWALTAAVLLFAFRLFGGEGTFKQAFSTTLYAWLPLTMQSLIAMFVIIWRGTVDPREMPAIVASSPAFLVDFKEHPILFSFLSSFDIFTLWTLVLLIIGFAWVSRFSKARSAAMIVSIWAVCFVLIKVGFAAIGAARMKSGS